MEIIARARHLRISPRKVRKMADLVSRRSVEQAKTQLMHMPHRSATPLIKLLDSAVHNAKNNFGIDNVAFYIKSIVVDGGPVAKRFRPGSAGRVNPYTKRTSHVTLVIDDKGLGVRTKKHAHNQTTKSDSVEEHETSSDRTTDKKEKFSHAGKKASVVKPKVAPRKLFQRKAIGS